MNKLRVLLACEESQAVTKEFRLLGHDAYSCDILPCSGGHPEWHLQQDVTELLRQDWDLVIAHPPCTVLSNSGVRWLISKEPKNSDHIKLTSGLFMDRKRYQEVIYSTDFFNKFIEYGKNGHAIAIENPIQHKYAKQLIHGQHSQIIQPYQFGHTETKATCLWLFNLPKLIETNNVYNEMMKLTYAERSKIHYASPGPDRAKIRSKTYNGIARAMAEQWSEYLTG